MNARAFILRFRAPLRELPRSTSLYGHLAWAMRWRHGEEGLEAFLRDFEQDRPPFLLSSAFPVARRGDDPSLLLPRPKLPPTLVEDTRKRKALKQIRYLSLEQFEAVAEEGEQAVVELLDDPNLEASHGALLPRGCQIEMASEQRTRVGINRLTGSHEPGVLFSDRVLRIKEAVVYVVSRNESYGPEWLKNMLSLVGAQGFGGGKSVGYGTFEVLDMGDVVLPETKTPTAHTLLSPALPPEGRGWYAVEPYWGRLGEHFALAANPFKRAYVRAVEGSTFSSPPAPAVLDLTPNPPPADGVRIREFLIPFTLGVRA